MSFSTGLSVCFSALACFLASEVSSVVLEVALAEDA